MVLQYLPLVRVCLVTVPQGSADKSPALLRSQFAPHLLQHLLQLIPSHLRHHPQ